MQSFPSMEDSFISDTDQPPRPSYQVINSTPVILAAYVFNCLLRSLDVLRVVRKGVAIKNEVDDAIDLCAGVLNLRDSIEASRAQCEQTTADERQRKSFASKGAYTN